jgi:hypothetical protein
LSGSEREKKEEEKKTFFCVENNCSKYSKEMSERKSLMETKLKVG